MPITLTFDTPEELQAFLQQGSLEGVTVKKTRGRKKGAAKAAAKPGRPAGKKAAVKPAAKKAAVSKKATAGKKVTAAKAGRKATAGKKAAVAKKPVAKKAIVKAVKASKVAKPKKAVAKVAAVKKPKANGKLTLTSKIKDTIQKSLDARKSFTANDIYDDMAKREKGINKQSVITSVLKQMNSTFSNVKVTERAGAGPRPVKLYNP